MPSQQIPRVFNALSTGIVASSSGANFQIGFRPQILRIENFGAVDLWVKFGTTSTAASTGDVFISSCADHRVLQFVFESRPLPIGQFSIFATSTAAQVNVIALAG